MRCVTGWGCGAASGAPMARCRWPRPSASGSATPRRQSGSATRSTPAPGSSSGCWPGPEAAAAQARTDGMLGEDVAGSGFSFDVTIVEGAGSYVVGEETALLACLQGLRGTVSARPPFPAQRGVYGLPTVVNNVETLCNVPFIAYRGAEAYRALSPGATAGSKLVCFNERF